MAGWGDIRFNGSDDAAGGMVGTRYVVESFLARSAQQLESGRRPRLSARDGRLARELREFLIEKADDVAGDLAEAQYVLGGRGNGRAGALKAESQPLQGI